MQDIQEIKKPISMQSANHWMCNLLVIVVDIWNDQELSLHQHNGEIQADVVT